jgi:hypothetical protein
LISISSLETAITKLEEDLHHLHYQLCDARNERLLAENKPECLLPTASDCQPSTACDCTREEVSYLQIQSSNLFLKSHLFYYENCDCFFVNFLFKPEQTLRYSRFKDYHQVEDGLSTEPEDQQDDEKDAEDGEHVSLNMLVEKHQDVSLTGLLEHILHTLHGTYEN